MRLKWQRRCDGVRRRDFIGVGGLTAFGLGIGDWFGMQRAVGATTGATQRAKSCILIWLDGGPSHLETFDPKPEAPAEVRGPMGSIATSIPGIRLNECFEKTATLMGHLAIVRSVSSPLGEHNFGTHYLMTGYKPSPALEYPTFGATIAHLRSQPTSDDETRAASMLPPNIAVPSFTRNLSAAGFLPAQTSPFSVGGNPDAADFKVRDLDFYPGLNLERLDRRRSMVKALDGFSASGPVDQAADQSVDSDLDRAYRLIASAEAKRAFELSEESDAVRARYGRGNGVGQSCLLARRLVERGVPFVTINSSGWDTHQSIDRLKTRYSGDRNGQLPSLDRAISGLVADLAERNMLDETLVVVMGEFGRTPKINAAGGRDHWPNVFTALLAGGGIQGGQVYGQSDSLGEMPHENPVSPSDLAATIYQLLGVDPAGLLHTADGRPVRIAPEGSTVIRELAG